MQDKKQVTPQVLFWHDHPQDPSALSSAGSS
jgi:hypothetical protein